MVQLEFELAYFNVAVLHISHCAIGTPPLKFDANTEEMGVVKKKTYR